MDSVAGISVVLLPIKPDYALPLIEGRKKVEFRKTAFRTPPHYVVVYASSPLKRVVGFFAVSDIRVDSVDNLWRDYGEVGCITQEDFNAYYACRPSGLALEVGDVVALEEPMTLDELGLEGRPPQSFAYISHDIVERLRTEATPL